MPNSVRISDVCTAGREFDKIRKQQEVELVILLALNQ